LWPIAVIKFFNLLGPVDNHQICATLTNNRGETMNNEHYAKRPFHKGEVLKFQNSSGETITAKITEVTRHTTTRVYAQVLDKHWHYGGTQFDYRMPVRYLKSQGFGICVGGSWYGKPNYWLTQ
jgi:hypothetical protein